MILLSVVCSTGAAAVSCILARIKSGQLEVAALLVAFLVLPGLGGWGVFCFCQKFLPWLCLGLSVAVYVIFTWVVSYLCLYLGVVAAGLDDELEE